MREHCELKWVMAGLDAEEEPRFSFNFFVFCILPAVELKFWLIYSWLLLRPKPKSLFRLTSKVDLDFILVGFSWLVWDWLDSVLPTRYVWYKFFIVKVAPLDRGSAVCKNGYGVVSRIPTELIGMLVMHEKLSSSVRLGDGPISAYFVDDRRPGYTDGFWLQNEGAWKVSYSSVKICTLSS